MIVAVEGIDASGKYTQARLLAESLQRLGPTTLLSFPRYESPIGAVIKQVLTNELHIPDSSRALVIQALFVSDRYEMLTVLREHHQDKSKHLVLDRYYASGLVYGQAEGLSLAYLTDIHRGLPPADLWFLLDTSVDRSVLRRPDRRDANERDLAKLSAVSALYRELFKSKALGGRSLTIDGNKSIEEVQDLIEEETLKHHKSMSSPSIAELARGALSDETQRKTPKGKEAGSKVWKSREPRLAQHVLQHAGNPLPKEISLSSRELTLLANHRSQVEALERTISDLHAELRESRFQRDRSKFAYEAAYDLASKIARECADPDRIDTTIERTLRDLDPSTERGTS